MRHIYRRLMLPFGTGIGGSGGVATKTERLISIKKFENLTNQDEFNLGSLDLTNSDVRLEVYYNGKEIMPCDFGTNDNGDFEIMANKTSIKTNTKVNGTDTLMVKIFYTS